ncbi:MAG: hypothetical protein FWF69_01965 [Firmicutes bacterium]|nr:hypothetical protein [Bacillota bacterium]
MMKKKAFLFAAVWGTLAVCAGALALEEVVVNVVDGRFVCGGYDVALAEAEKPIAFGYIHGEAIVRIWTEDGMEEISFGQAQIALTQDAAPYVTELAYELEEIPDTDEICPACGRSTKIGNHTILPCGHWGCLKAADHLRVCSYCHGYLCNGKDHSLCPHCKVHWCVHVDIACPYTRNPAPTPYTTSGPDGKAAYYRIDSSPTAGGYEGKSDGKELGWAPQDAFMKTRPTQPPTPRPEGAPEEDGAQGGNPRSGGAQGGPQGRP